ncbi:MAG TPA: MBL fold metallo-hydrolase [Thermoanaerobaculia bacterium]|jgi:glyoxylase-like metal-dependent hydrolase (beta-lactamase superfamily II)|nr:MBL fold metallo-hydrolase [Thermoanaerobaculia bacterium]
MNIRSITAPNPGPFTLDGTKTYLVDERVVIDPGPNIASHVDAIRAAMPALDTILITHRHADHAPAALPLKQATGARIVAPHNVLEETDEVIAGGEFVEGLEVIATPGHTNEHVCFLSPDGDLFTGDTILGFGTTAIFPPDGDMADYIASLRKLRAREPRRIFPAHGPVRDDAVALIDEYIAHRLDRERQVIAALRGGARTIPELRKVIYPDLDSRLHGAAEAQLHAHLIKLLREGIVTQHGETYATGPAAQPPSS